MYKFSKRSKNNLATCNDQLQFIAKIAIKYFDFTVVEGHREKEKQNKYFEKGTSKLKWPKSKHNKKPSLAFDLVPYPIDWNDTKRFYYLAGLIKGIAASNGIEIKWGGEWKKFLDLPHFQLEE